eukprot:TRINITY_DN1696_c0_g1_i1.p10 TRINITY_DN1696_c0_g1~~TRINITY_DN1696_c0_g1_i1.p10  ORF type:complete len:136 (-),score=3.80 TRINITY_DN1696_c0_g1_i1:1964-2371(-)
MVEAESIFRSVLYSLFLFSFFRKRIVEGSKQKRQVVLTFVSVMVTMIFLLVVFYRQKYRCIMSVCVCVQRLFVYDSKETHMNFLWQINYCVGVCIQDNQQTFLVDKLVQESQDCYYVLKQVPGINQQPKGILSRK